MAGVQGKAVAVLVNCEEIVEGNKSNFLRELKQIELESNFEKISLKAPKIFRTL